MTRCTATTQAREQCARRVLLGYVCWQHRELAPTDSMPWHWRVLRWVTG